MGNYMQQTSRSMQHLRRLLIPVHRDDVPEVPAAAELTPVHAGPARCLGRRRCLSNLRRYAVAV